MSHKILLIGGPMDKFEFHQAGELPYEFKIPDMADLWDRILIYGTDDASTIEINSLEEIKTMTYRIGPGVPEAEVIYYFVK